MKYAWIDAHRKEFELTELCQALSVSPSGYRAWKDGGTPDGRANAGTDPRNPRRTEGRLR